MSENIRKLLNSTNPSANNNDKSIEINPHMPQYITKAPWYLNQSENSLNHQKSQIANNKLPISIHTQKGIFNKPVYKFRKGACENCGSMTHTAKECCERPRAVKAKYSGKDLRQDEFIYEVPLDYEGKRDRWNGYDSSNFKKFIYEYEKLEDAKKQSKEEELKRIDDEKKKKKKMRDEDLDESVSSEDENRFLTAPSEEANENNPVAPSETENSETWKNNKSLSNSTVNEKVIAEDNEDSNKLDEDDEIVKIYSEGISVQENNKKILNIKNLKELLYKSSTSKSLHIGDDYSKYLLSLKENSAYYDPKSRSMRENPVPDSNLVFRGENALRQSGDALSLLEIENFIKEANQKNRELNLNNVSMPTQAEKFYEYYKQKKENFKSDHFKKLLDKYGGKECLDLPDSIKSEFQPDSFNESSNDNAGLNTNLDDQGFIDHSTEYGSFYHPTFGKGYKCCLSFDKESSCGGNEALNQNFSILKEYENLIKKEIENEKQMIKKKEEDLKLRNQKEAANGIFSEMMSRMDAYERGDSKSNPIINSDNKASNFDEKTFLRNKRKFED